MVYGKSGNHSRNRNCGGRGDRGYGDPEKEKEQTKEVIMVCTFGTDPQGYNAAAGAVSAGAGAVAVGLQFIPGVGTVAGGIVGLVGAATSGLLKVLGSSDAARASERTDTYNNGFNAVIKAWTDGNLAIGKLTPDKIP